MNGATAVRYAGRVLAFARHIPFAKLTRRIELHIQRRIRDAVGLTYVSLEKPPIHSTRPPSPLFAPRVALAPVKVSGGAEFHFLNRSHLVATSEAGLRHDWSAPGSGGANQLWRMNLHYMEYLEGFADEEWTSYIDDWIRQNGSGRVGAWRDSWNSYALSLRVVVWLQELARRRSRLPHELVERVEASAANQLRFLERNLETDIGGNHLIKNIKALIWASAYFAGADADRWRSVGLTLLEAELRGQVLPDGVHSERSPSYHCQVFADLLECRHALGGDSFGGALDIALDRMAQAIIDLTHPDGGVALLNDSGLNMSYAPAACLDAYERVIGRRPRSRAVFAFPSAGYYGLRSNGLYLVADCGRIAPDDLPAHGHADVLSFELSAQGQRFFVDQGVFEYVAGDRRRRARAAATHNTLCFEGADQADFFGAFRCGRRPNVEVCQWSPGCESFILEGCHDGFSYLPDRPRHVRRFEAAPNRLSIHDWIDGPADRLATIGFLLHPEVTAEVSDDVALLRRGRTSLRLASSRGLYCREAVWWPDMGDERKSLRLVIELPVGVDHVVSEILLLDTIIEDGKAL